MMRWLAALVMLLPAPSVFAADRVDRPFEMPMPALGTAWYPEQWSEDRWDADLALMEAGHLKVVRIGEFAWARMEPEDGRFDFGWLDRAIAAARRHGLKVVLGTPTAAPPVWLTEQHPDVLRVNADGSVEGHGARRQFSFASATYRRYAVRIATEMARRYGRDPQVAGWQIDNEVGVPSYDRDARALWANWLQRRYGSITALNQRWTTQYWSQVYQRFDQVPLTLDPQQNPALLLNVRRFQSDVWADYVGAQARAIRAFADPQQFVTTNSTSWNDNFDQYRVHEPLDLAAWDEYVPDGHPDWEALALHHDIVRGYKQRDFWVMETQPGAVNWGKTNRALDPGVTRELAWQAVAHGADAILYWQWRSALNGQEQYHGTLVGPDDRPMPIYGEVTQTAVEMEKLATLLARTRPTAQVAMLYSQDSRWATEQQRFAADYDAVKVMQDWYRPFAEAGIGVDVIPPYADLSRYRLLLAPNLNVLPRMIADRLIAWVHSGGHLVLGPRSGMKDDENALWLMRQPGPLADLLGGHVGQYYALDKPVPIDTDGEDAASFWAETLELASKDAVVLAHYEGNGWLSGKPAILERQTGQGRITYVGTLLRSRAQARWSARWIGQDEITRPPIAPKPGIEIVEREGPGRHLWVVVNHGDQEVTLTASAGIEKVMAGDGEQLRGHGMAIYAEK